MDPTSDYKFFRYFMFLNYILGHFTANHILTEDSDKLDFKIALLPNQLQIQRANPTFFATLTTLLFVALHLNAIHPPQSYVSSFLKHLLRYICIFYTSQFPYRLCLTLSSLYYLCGLAVLDTRRAWERYSRTWCSLYLCLETFCTVLLEQTRLLNTINKDLGKQVLLLLIYRFCNTYCCVRSSCKGIYSMWSIVQRYMARFKTYTYEMVLRVALCLTLSSLYYLCGLAVLDTRRAWERYSRTWCSPYLCLETFCTVLLEQTHLLQTIDKDLGKQVLLLLIYRSCTVVTYMSFNATYEDPMKPASELYYWVYCRTPYVSRRLL
ncbi:hypothetical protein J6590_093733 [Homalodisca vitripennis]|nr:hypothetical protein J6590_093733 [Homalodisca vitripennis]